MKNIKKKQKKNSIKALIDRWDKKLAKTGFRDIEDRRTGLLKSWSGTVPVNNEVGGHKPYQGGYSSLAWKESQETYFRLCGAFLYSKKFKSQSHKEIWRLHSEGRTIKEVAAYVGLTQRQVKYAINCMQKQFGLRLSRIHTIEATQGSDIEPSKSSHSNPRRRA